MGGIELKRSLLGKNSSLEVHHIFPKDLLYKHDYDKMQVNTLANYTFLTKESNLMITNKDPHVYLKEINSSIPGVLQSHWTPTNEELWTIDNYLEFVKERRRLLAKAANDFLNELYNDEKEVEVFENISSVELDLSEEDLIIDLSIWMEQNGLNTGVFNYEVVDDQSNTLAVFDIAWPDGVQEGLSKPVAVLIDEPDHVHAVANANGYVYYTNVDDFKSYVIEKFIS